MPARVPPVWNTHCRFTGVPTTLFDAEKYSQGKFIQTLPEQLQEDIYKYGTRNSHLLSIAPTGTISLCADNISSGMEPVFAYNIQRTIAEFDGPRTEVIHDYGVAHFGVHGVQSKDVTIEQHLNVLATATRLIDSAASKTCNVPSSMPWDEFKGVYQKAWELGCKGITTFNPDGARMGIMREAPTQSDEVVSCEVDPSSGRRSCE